MTFHHRSQSALALLLTLLGVASALAQPTPVAPVARAPWSFGELGYGAGLSGLEAAENTIDGQLPIDAHSTRPEFYVGGSGASKGANRYWSAYTRGAQLVFISELMPSAIKNIGVLHYPTSNVVRTPFIAVALEDGSLWLYEQWKKRFVGAWDGPCTSHGGLRVQKMYDVDGDMYTDMISICQSDTLFVHGFRDKWSLPGVGGQDIVVAQMDDDGAVEIATTSGIVIDASTRSVQWRHPEGFGAHLGVGNIDGDQDLELFAADAMNVVHAYDVGRQLRQWTIRTDRPIDAILFVHRFDGQSQTTYAELLVADGMWGQIHAFDIFTRQEVWAKDNPDYGVSAMTTYTTVVGGQILVWTSGAGSESSHFFEGSLGIETIDIHNKQMEGPFLGPVVADLDGNGAAEIVTASSSSDGNVRSGRIAVISSQTGWPKVVSPPVALGASSEVGIQDLKVRDLDGDGKPEIVIATGAGDHCFIEAYKYDIDGIPVGGDLGSLTRLWSRLSHPLISTIEVADVDGDGTLELIAGVRDDRTGTDGTYVYVYDLLGFEKWHTPVLSTSPNPISQLLVSDIDGDGTTEIAALVTNVGIYIFNGKTHTMEAAIDEPATAMTFFNAGPGKRALLIGDATGHLSMRMADGAAYAEVYRGRYAAAAIDGVHVTNDGALWLGSAGVLRRYKGTSVFVTANYGTGLGRSLAPMPNGAVLTAGGYGIHAFVPGP